MMPQKISVCFCIVKNKVKMYHLRLDEIELRLKEAEDLCDKVDGDE